MEGKTLILSVLLMSLFMAQIQVDAKSCCPSTTARNIYNTCRFAGSPRPVCASLSGCKNISGTKCPNGYTHDILENTGDAVTKYCKVGCVSSVCGALTNLQNSDASEVVNGAVEQCANACSTVCTKDSMNAVETA
ncbi:PREDICTED: probable thionin-2.4 [Camelina sativa]|uniref:Probable thionin-2.4 n=1 Tax=Camelina sativa TaxID=90675 RepID=A0ABM0WF08_CAMSA|nr:PREDICTED: probable thionin-2.4 [Camelina sativa]